MGCGSGTALSWGLVRGCEGMERGDAKSMLFSGAPGIRSLFQGHSPGGASLIV